MRSFLSYYRRVLAHAFHHGAKWGRDQLIGLLLALVIVFAQLQMGLLVRSQVNASLASIAWPYFLLFLLFIMLYLLRAPWQLDRERESEIGTLKQKVAVGVSRDAVARFMRAAQDLKRNAPRVSDTEEQVEAWRVEFRDWLDSALRQFERGSEAEIAIFLDTSNVKDVWYPDKHPDVQRDILTLDVRVRNLKVILGPF